jgi:hypothetical protein
MIAKIKAVSQSLAARITLTLFAFTALAQERASAAILHVPAQFPTIQSAIDGAVDGDTVAVSPGIYPEGIDFRAKRIQITSSAGPLLTVIELGTVAGACVLAQSGEQVGTAISGLTIRGGTVGAVHVRNDSHLQLNNCRIIDCSRIGAGGAACTVNGASLVLENCELSNALATINTVNNAPINPVATGGAVLVEADGYLHCLRSRFSNCQMIHNSNKNEAFSVTAGGGAISLSASLVELAECDFDNCGAHARRTGGIVYGHQFAFGGAIFVGDGAILDAVATRFGTSAPCFSLTEITRSEHCCQSPDPRITLQSRGAAVACVGANASLRLDSCSFHANLLWARVGSLYDSDATHNPLYATYPTFEGSAVYFAPTSGSTTSLISDCVLVGAQQRVDTYIVGDPCVGQGCTPLGHNIFTSINGMAFTARPGNSPLVVRDTKVWQVALQPVLLQGGIGCVLERIDIADCGQTALRCNANPAIVLSSLFRRNGTPLEGLNSGTGPTVAGSLFCQNSPNTIAGVWTNGGNNTFSAACITNDCNSNGIDDAFEISSGLAPDCNSNNRPDACDIASASSEDCDDNEVPDECQFPAENRASTPLSPVQSGTTLTYSFIDMPDAGTDVTLSLDAIADLSSATETIQVRSGGAVLGTLFQSGGLDCTPVTGEIQIPQEQFNQLRSKSGTFSLQLIPSFAVTAGTCTSSSVTIRIEYQPIANGDCNGNSIPDVCDVLSGESADSNANLIPDECEELVACVGDLNTDAEVSAADLSLLLAAWNSSDADLDGDGTTAASDLSLLLANWGACP